MPGGFVHVSNGVSGHVVADRIFLPCQVAYGRATAPRGRELFLGPNISFCTSIASSSRSLPLLCKASSNKRYLDFSRLYKGSSTGKNRQNQERENPDNPDDNLQSSRNGPLASPAGKQRPSATATATATPEQRKEIISLFRKVQTQLRERAAKKKEQSIEAAQQGEGEKGTAAPFLKLDRLLQGRNRGSEDGYDLDQPPKIDSFDHLERGDPFELEQSSTFLESDSFGTVDGVQDPKPVHPSRPFSSFRRKPPVTRAKYQPVLAAEEEDVVHGKPSLESNWKPKPDVELQPGHLREDNNEGTAFESFGDDWEMSSHLSDSSDAEETDQEISGSCLGGTSNLHAMTVPELRSLAKSRGIKGYSKLKKSVLLELLAVEHA